MPTRATKRGAERTPLSPDADVIVCGASFAGLAVARELEGAGARVLLLDRYEIGERQTSACGIPTDWLRNLGLPWQQTFSELVVHTPARTSRHSLPYSFSTFDYRTVCGGLRDQGSSAEFETAKVEGRTGRTVHTDRGDVTAPFILDALGWRRILAPGENVQPPEAFLSRGLEVHPGGGGEELEIWIDRGYVRDGYGWSFPAGEEVRVGIGSFEPRDHVKDGTNRLAEDLGRDRLRYQGNWIPHRIRPAAEDGVYFAGDSAGHCIPLTAEGIRTALYFGIAAGQEIRSAFSGGKPRPRALADYAAFSAAHRWKFEAMLGWQRLIPRMPPRALALLLRGLEHKETMDVLFEHYLRIAHPDFAGPARRIRMRTGPRRERRRALAA